MSVKSIALKAACPTTVLAGICMEKLEAVPVSMMNCCLLYMHLLLHKPLSHTHPDCRVVVHLILCDLVMFRQKDFCKIVEKVISVVEVVMID